MSLIDRIEAKLVVGVDPDVFERAAAALLSDLYPTLAPIEAGRDQGRDGDIYFVDEADAESRGRLLATTGDPLANLKRSHKRWLVEGLADGRYRVDSLVVACSRDVTGTMRKKMEQYCRANALPLPVIYGRDWFVDKLSRNPEWCESLTGIRGRLEALRKATKPDTSLVERADELAALREALDNGDLVLCGVPGIGKTRLLEELEDVCFLEPLAHEHLASDLLAIDPRVVVLDDAHLNLDLLETLARLRAQEGLTFNIAASTWPDVADDVLSRLEGAAEVRAEPITRVAIDQIVVRRGVRGIRARNAVLRQAEGRPGWATALCESIVNGEGDGVVTGRVLVDQVDRYLRERTASRTSMDVLAHIAAIDGASVEDLERIAPSVGIPAAEVTAAVEAMATAGFVDRRAGKWYLQPSLRAPIVSSWFFGEKQKRSWSSVLDLFPDRAEDVTTSLFAAADVSGDGQAVDLADVWAEQLPTPEDWDLLTIRHVADYAALGTRQADFAVKSAMAILRSDRTPAASFLGIDLGASATEDIVRDCVRRAFVPSAVHALLDLAVGDRRTQHNTPNHPIRVLGDTVRQIVPDHGSLYELRPRLIDEAIAWLGDSTDEQRWVAATEAACAAMRPDVEGNWLEPGAGKTLTLSHGVESDANLTGLGNQWPRVEAGLLRCGSDVVPAFVIDLFVALAEEWLRVAAGHGPGAAVVTDAQRAAASTVGWSIIKSLMPHLRLDFGPALRARSVVDRAEHHWGLERPRELSVIEVDEDLALFAGLRDLDDDVDAWLQQRDEDAEEIARRIALLGAEQGVARFKELNEAATPPDGHSDGHHVLRFMRDAVPDPENWLAPATRAEVPALLGTMLECALRDGDIGDTDLVSSAMDNAGLRPAVVGAVISCVELTESVRVLVDQLTDADAWQLDRLFVKDVVDDVLYALLTHDSRGIRAAAALAFNMGTRHGPALPPEWESAWLDAFVDAHAGVVHGHLEWRLQEILKSLATTQPALCVRWIERRIADGTTDKISGRRSGEVGAVIGGLDRPSRRRLVEGCADNDPARRALLPALIGGDESLLDELLNDGILSREAALDCLTGARDADARKVVPVLARRGVDSARIAMTVGGFGSYWGNESDELKRGIEWWTSLETEAPEAGQAAQFALNHLRHQLERALQEESDEEIHGWG
jgi:hypothetical protein